MNTNIDEWISEFPHLRDFLVSGHFDHIFATTQPKKGRRIGDKQWEKVVKQIGPLNTNAG